jgi:hypothetical protein
MKRAFMVLAVCTAVLTGLFSQELADNSRGEQRITAVSVIGLKRTKPYIAETPLQKFIGMDADSIDNNEVIAVVKSTGVIEPLSVEIIDNQEGNGKTLVVTVKEKWTIFPIPIISVNSSGWSAGGVLADANAFGLKDMMMVMGIFGTGDLTASVMYINTPDRIGAFGWNVMGFFSLQENETTDQTGERILQLYNSMSINPTIGLSYSWREHITPSLSLSYRYVGLRDTDNPINAPENGVHALTLSPSINIRYNSWDGYFLNDKNASLKYNYTFVINDEDVHSVSINAAFNHSLIPGFRFTAKSGMTFAAPSASPFFESSSASIPVSILAQRYSAHHIAGLSLGLEKYLLKFKFGMLSVSAAYQGVYSYSSVLEHQADHGAAAMLQMYFSGVALPAMGLGGAYNVDKNIWQYAFNVGMSF